MAARSSQWRLALVIPGLLLAGCFDEPPLEGVPVFEDAFTAGLSNNPFQFSTPTSIDTGKAHSGRASIRMDVPTVATGYVGGAVLAGSAQSLIGQNALVFWATASRDVAFDEVGFGIDFDAGPPYPYRTSVTGLPLTTEWTRHLIPIPDPSKLTDVKGMLYYVDTDTGGATVWLDDISYERLDEATIGLSPTVATASRSLQPGAAAPVSVAIRYTDLDGTERSLDSFGPGSGPARAWFQFASSNPAVSTVDGAGQVTAVAVGTAEITARLGGTTVPGVFTVNVVSSLPTVPTTAPPAPTAAPGDVISLLSTAYTSVPVDTWRTVWSAATLASPDPVIGGDPVKLYTALDFVGVEFTNANVIDATAMTHFHVDVWTPNATTFRVKLVDAGADGDITTTGDNSEAEVAFDAGSTPALATGGWVSLDIPFTAMPTLTARAHLAQLIFSALPTATTTVYVDNVYFRR
jgi:hypothetical protein